jgi:omega-6 fatty acid desaturase (delta-12 desaturase)
LALLPAYHPYTSWRYAHNVLHHGGTCLKQKQPDFPPMSKEEFQALPRWRRRLERIYRSALGVGLCYAVEFYVRCLLFPVKKKRSPEIVPFHLDRLLVVGFLIAQLGVAYSLSAVNPELDRAPGMYAGVIVLPWLTWMYFMGVATFVQHTHPRTVWYDNHYEWNFFHVQLCSSTHMVLPRVADFLLHNIMHHPAHHLDPTIPLYELPASQQSLEEYAPEHSVVVPFTLREYLRICRKCKLYDYRHHRWLDFDGNPTTESAILGEGVVALSSRKMS